MKSPYGIVAAQSGWPPPSARHARGRRQRRRCGGRHRVRRRRRRALDEWLGGGGFMVVAKADGSPPEVVDFSMIAPAALDPADYPLAGGTAQALFAWPAVKEDRNLRAITRSPCPARSRACGWRSSGSADRLAAGAGAGHRPRRRGLPLDWYATLSITVAARELTEFPAARTVYLPGGCHPCRREGAGHLSLGSRGARCAVWPRPVPATSRGRGAAALSGSGEGGSRSPRPICAIIAPVSVAGARHRLSRRQCGGRGGPQRRPDFGGRVLGG